MELIGPGEPQPAIDAGNLPCGLIILRGRIAIGGSRLLTRFDVRFFARLNCMFRARSDLLTAVFLFLLDFFVVGNVAWVCHGGPVVVEEAGPE